MSMSNRSMTIFVTAPTGIRVQPERVIQAWMGRMEMYAEQQGRRWFYRRRRDGPHLLLPWIGSVWAHGITGRRA